MGSGSGPEDLGTDTGSGDSGAVCGARAASVVQEGGRAARPRRGLPGCGALNVPFMQSWDRVPFKARLAPPGAPSRHQVQNCVSSPPPVAPCCPEPTSQSRLFLRLHLSRFSSAPPPWTPLSSATWPCCSRRSCPVGSCRPTSGGCTTSVPTAPISSASTSPGREVRGGWVGGGRQPWERGAGIQELAPLPTFLPCPSAEVPRPRQTPASSETEEEPYRRRNQILSVLAGLAAMAGYALLSGIVSIQRAPPARAPSTRALGMAEEDEEE